MTLKNNKISTELLEFLKYKINVSALSIEFNKVVQAFQLMLEDGMTYYTYSYYKNVIACEMNIFYNMLDIIHLWKNKIFVMSDLLFHYIKPNRNYSFNLSKIDFHGVNLRGMDLRGMDLRGMDLRGSNLSGLDLNGMDLREADLREANLKGANLRGANLRGANLRNADLRNANLREINLREADLREADLREADLSKGIIRETDLSQAKLSRVNLSESDLRWSTLLNVDINDIKGINMRNVKIEYSIWMENDIRRILSELKEVGFAYFAINDKYGKKRVYRKDALIE